MVAQVSSTLRSIFQENKKCTVIIIIKGPTIRNYVKGNNLHVSKLWNKLNCYTSK